MISIYKNSAKIKPHSIKNRNPTYTGNAKLQQIVHLHRQNSKSVNSHL